MVNFQLPYKPLSLSLSLSYNQANFFLHLLMLSNVTLSATAKVMLMPPNLNTVEVSSSIQPKFVNVEC